MIFLGSDGFFDPNIWSEDELVKCASTLRQEHGLAEIKDVGKVESETMEERVDGISKLGAAFFDESLNRSYRFYDYKIIDDISLLCAIVG